MKKALKILLYIVAALVLIQFIPVDRSNVPVDPNLDFVRVMDTPSEVKAILKSSCYDCHSNETRYPKYSYIAPFSWSVKHHVNKARKHLNFSEWGGYNPEQKQGILDKTLQVLEDRKMPLPVYVSYHEEAALTPEDRKMLTAYFKLLSEAQKK